MAGVALTKNNPTLRKIVRRHFEMHPVAHDRADAKFAHLAGSVGDNLVLVIEPDGEASVGKNFLDDASIVSNSSLANGLNPKGMPCFCV